MKLNYLINSIKSQITSIHNLSGNSLGMDIKGLALNSKLVAKGYIFFCLSGTRNKGTDFINEAYSNGSRVIVLEADIKTKLPIIVIKVKDAIQSLAVISGEFYGHPSQAMDMTAITGTNGKTTTTFIIENILKTFRKKVGVVGTINYRFGNNTFTALNTTPDIITLNNLFKEMVDNKVKFLLMEVSSHALAQRRIAGIEFNQAIFTNLSQDHFDYHRTKRNYFLAKAALFTDYIKNNGTAIINIDDNYGLKLRDLIRNNKKAKIITYGIKRKSDIIARDISFDSKGCYFTVVGLGHKFNLKTNLVGIYNVYNALASIADCLVLGIPPAYIIQALENIYVPGRLEKVSCWQKDISIFIDYAHTPDALKNVLLSLQRLKGRGRLIIVFGCGGDRDKDKRPKMGRLASQLADFTIITSDNPRREDPLNIISQIRKGIDNNNYTQIVDRKDAIEKALDMAVSGDTIIVAGKGHEDYQILKDKRIDFNDRLVIEEILAKKGLS